MNYGLLLVIVYWHYIISKILGVKGIFFDQEFYHVLYAEKKLTKNKYICGLLNSVGILAIALV